MENNTQNHQEIDLIYLFKKIKEFIFNIGLVLYKVINFIKNNILILIILILIGAGTGYLIEKSIFSSERSELMVIPNFDSTSFLYNEIEILNQSKNKIPELKGLLNVRIEPIIELNNLGTSNNEFNNKELLKDFFEKGKEFDQLMKDEKLLTLYKSHLIILETSNKNVTKKIVDYILNRLNTNTYFLEKKKYEQDILKEKEYQLNKSIVQINNILNKLGSSEILIEDKGVNINTYSEISSILNQKNTFIKELSKVKDQIITSKDIVYSFDKSLNINKIKKIQNNYKILFPILFIALFLVFKFYGFLRNKYHKFL